MWGFVHYESNTPLLSALDDSLCLLLPSTDMQAMRTALGTYLCSPNYMVLGMYETGSEYTTFHI